MTAPSEGRLEELHDSNIVRARITGDWGGPAGPKTLFADIACFSSRIGHQGGAKSSAAVRAYLEAYRSRGTLGPIPFDMSLAHALARYA